MKYNLETFAAGKLAGIALTKPYKEREALLKTAPPELLPRIKEIIASYDEKEALKLAKMIASLKTRVERQNELIKVPPHLRSVVKSTVISIFEQSKNGAKR